MKVDLPSSSAIEPRMSVLLKGTTCFEGCENLSEELGLSDSESEHEDSLCFTKLDPCDDECKEMHAFRRSPLSATSINLTGTTYSILRSSAADEAATERRQEKTKTQIQGIRFEEEVKVRNHIHVKDISDYEKLAAWFRKPEYKMIFKNNTQIITIIEKREREMKKLLAKKQRENKKKKTRKSIGLNMAISKTSEVSCTEVAESSCAEVMVGEDDLHEQNFGIDDIIEVHRDDERGFSVRGLENETAKKRRIRDQTYLKAKMAVLSIQEDIDEHMFSLQEQHEEQLSLLSRGKKKNKRRFSLNRQQVPEDQEEDSEKLQQMMEAAREEFAELAKSQYKTMIRKISERYAEICMQDALDALERGLQDEKTVRAIDWIQSEGGDTSHGSILSSAKGVSDSQSSQDQEKRRPSTTSTAPTEISVVSSLISSEGMQLSRVKRAKMFLSKFV